LGYLHRDLLLANHTLNNYFNFLTLRGIAQDRTQWRQLVNTIVQQVTTRCFQELRDNENKSKEDRRRRQLDTVTLNYTDAEGQRKRIRLTTGGTGSTNLRLRLPARRPRDPDHDMDLQLNHAVNRRRIEEQERNIHNIRDI